MKEHVEGSKNGCDFSLHNEMGVNEVRGSEGLLRTFQCYESSHPFWINQGPVHQSIEGTATRPANINKCQNVHRYTSPDPKWASLPAYIWPWGVAGHMPEAGCMVAHPVQEISSHISCPCLFLIASLLSKFLLCVLR